MVPHPPFVWCAKLKVGEFKPCEKMACDSADFLIPGDEGPGDDAGVAQAQGSLRQAVFVDATRVFIGNQVVVEPRV